MNGNLVVLKENEIIVDKIIQNIKVTYPLKPSILFLDKEQMDNFRASDDTKGWNLYDSSQLDLLTTLKKGVLLLTPKEYRGLNTPFAISATVEIGCKVTSETQYE